MHCPNCAQDLHEHAPMCPHCSFNLATADRLFGIPPQLSSLVSDLAGALKGREKKMLLEELSRQQTLLPQVRVAVVLTRLSSGVSMRAYSFWLFNKGGLATSMEKGGDCHLLLLTLDIECGRSSCIIGYGLEPFVGAENLNRILAAGAASLQEKQYAASVLASLQQAMTELRAIVQAIPQTYGLQDVSANDETAWQGEEFAY